MWVALLLPACSTPAPAPAPVAAPSVTPEAAPAAAEPAAEPAAEKPAPAVRKRPPSLTSIDITPIPARASDTLVAKLDAANIADPGVDLEFEWRVNGAPIVDVASETLRVGRYKKGDTVTVRVTADNGDDQVSLDSEPLVIANSPPVFETDGRAMKRVDGFAFKATDPDEDPLTWRIEGAPKGMSISSAGVLAYTGAEDEPGRRYSVAVIVDDGDAFGRFEFPLTVTAGSATKKAEK